MKILGISMIFSGGWSMVSSGMGVGGPDPKKKSFNRIFTYSQYLDYLSNQIHNPVLS